MICAKEMLHMKKCYKEMLHMKKCYKEMLYIDVCEHLVTHLCSKVPVGTSKTEFTTTYVTLFLLPI